MKTKKLLLVSICSLFLVGCGEQTSSVLSQASSDSSVTETSQTSIDSVLEASSLLPSSIVQEDSSVASSTKEEEEKTIILTKAYPGLLDNSNGNINVGDDGYKMNNVFTMMKGTTIDFGSKKTISYDGTDFSSEGRFKLNGAGSTSSKSIKITATSAGKLRFCCQSASGSDSSRTWSIAKAGEDPIFTSASGVSATTPDYFEFNIPEAGEYYLYSSVNGINIYYLDFTQELALGKETGFEINSDNMQKDYLIGDDISLANLLANAIYSSGARMEIKPADLEIDTSAYNKASAGEYQIGISYKTYAKQFVTVKVHAVSAIKSYYEHIQKSSGSKADAILRTPTIYRVNDAICSENIIVKAVTDDNKEMNITSRATITLPDMTSAGKKSIGVKYSNNNVEHTADISITVLDLTLSLDDKEEYNLAVSKEVTSEGELINNVPTFSSIQKAHDFYKSLKASNASITNRMNIHLGEETYEEKVYIEIPNVTLIGSLNEANHPNTTIAYSLHADSVDASGNAWSTYGSSTLSVNKNATGFKAKNLAIKNTAFNTMDEYTNCNSGNKQAVAAVLDCDATFDNCYFYGFQDTLYARLGHQVYNDCYIQGMADFIFGEDVEAIFNGGTIHCLNRNSTTNGGYICAPKPSSDTSVQVGFFFNNMTITAEEGVTQGTVSLARPWGKFARVTYANCTMPDAISKKAYGDTSDKKNPRFDQMSGNLPTNAHFAEYNNTGDGAITTAVAGGSILTETEYQALVTLVQNL